MKHSNWSCNGEKKINAPIFYSDDQPYLVQLQTTVLEDFRVFIIMVTINPDSADRDSKSTKRRCVVQLGHGDRW